MMRQAAQQWNAPREIAIARKALFTSFEFGDALAGKAVRFASLVNFSEAYALITRLNFLSIHYHTLCLVDSPAWLEFLAFAIDSEIGSVDG